MLSACTIISICPHWGKGGRGKMAIPCWEKVCLAYVFLMLKICKKYILIFTHKTPIERFIWHVHSQISFIDSPGPASCIGEKQDFEGSRPKRASKKKNWSNFSTGILTPVSKISKRPTYQWAMLLPSWAATCLWIFSKRNRLKYLKKIEQLSPCKPSDQGQSKFCQEENNYPPLHCLYCKNTQKNCNIGWKLPAGFLAY